MNLYLSMFAISLFKLIFHTLLQLLGNDSLLFYLVLDLLLAIGNNFIDFDHHDLENIVNN